MKSILATIILGIALAVSGCTKDMTAASAPMVSTSSAKSGQVSEAEAYRLGSGDKLRVIVFGEDSLSGEFEVDGSGFVAMPLVGQVKAGNLTLTEFSRALEARLRQGYLREPRASVEVLNYRPFYVIGEVKNPGKYPYVSGMTVINAVALAGGYSYRARENRVVIIRGEARREIDATEGTAVFPGDVIRVPERFF